MALTNIDEKLLNLPPLEKQPETPMENESPKIEYVEPEDNAPEQHVETLQNEAIVAQNQDKDINDNDETDDYGIKAEKKEERVFKQSEVEEMVRERLHRERERLAREQAQYQQPMQQQAQQEKFQYNDESNDTWEVQLERFIDKTLERRESRLTEQNWQAQEQYNQAQFEVKFNAGAAKYSDFESVVMGKSLTPSMVLATRGMADPAAFVYAAAKLQPQELDRISKINDLYAQTLELGRLEERMRKTTKSTSTAPKPIKAVTGDSGHKSTQSMTIEQKIQHDLERKFKRG
jgi:hypothetical protein